MLTAEKIWADASETLRGLLNSELFNLWFRPIRPVSVDGECLVLEVANDFSQLWLEDNYSDLLREVLQSATGKPLRVRFIVGNGAPPGPAAPAPTSALPEPVAAGSGDTERGVERNGAPKENVFNPRNTFEAFVVGDNNNFSHAAAFAVAQSPGKSYNPLFLYGGVGLGKTHLLHAIGQYVAQHRKNARVAYVSSEKFTNDYISAIQDNQLGRFRKRYRQSDVLLIDDIQFLAGKERIQEEFFHTFNARHEAHKQIVLTCDRPANEIQNLERRLVSRFEWGLVTDLQPPDIETRLAILRKKEACMGVQLPEDIVLFLAGRIRTNIRRLEGALIRVASYASLTGRKISVELVENLLREVLHEEGRNTITIDVIQRKVADHFDIRLSDMTSKRRPENIAFPRQIAMFLARRLTESSFSTIGDAFGGRDHGTVLHACRLVKGRMEVDAGVRQVVLFLEKQLAR